MIFYDALSKWYKKNKRDLPWRHTKDPYKIWISEIILQQTRVDQGLSYYYKFIDQYPDIQSLANSSEDRVLRSWQGLGYYSRARNIHIAAKDIMDRFSGKFPSNYQEIKSLKGIGDYTSAAIASFAFNLPYPVIDGNVNRLISRYFGVIEPIDTAQGKRIIAELTQEVFNSNDPAGHNQAIMEFGALFCIPHHPDCPNCPLNSSCKAYATDQVSSLPIKIKRVKVRKRYFTYLLINKEDQIALSKRSGNDIWKNMYQLPLLETDQYQGVEDLMNHQLWSKYLPDNSYTITSVEGPRIHKLSHQEIKAQFISVDFNDDQVALNENLQLIPINRISDYPIPKLIETFLEEKIFSYSPSEDLQ
jgi:A/G-specific adenine glycosylase